MGPQPSGRLIATEGGRYDMVLTRTFDATAEDVWGSLTDSARLALWFGTWEGTPGAGNTVQMRMGFEEGDATSAVLIEACEAPHHLAVATSVEGMGAWRLEAEVSESAGVTTLTFTHHLDDGNGVGDIGPGWEFYLDMLVASRVGAPLPDFGDYHPAQSEHYTQQLAG